MEDVREGTVAIIEGLQDSGIAVTVLNNRRSRNQEKQRQRPRAYSKRRSFEMPKIKYSVKTSTDSVNRVNRSAQICDGRYASSYQLAHCNMNPTSPVVHMPEFPPQRTEPCRTQGNFELPGYGNGNSWSYHSRETVPTFNSLGNGYISSDKGYVSSVHRSQSSRTDEAFAHSLRRYPHHSPDGTLSTEYIQKLISYTQNKHRSTNSRRMRSLSQEFKSKRKIHAKMCHHEIPTKNDDDNDILVQSKSSQLKNIVSNLRNDQIKTRCNDSTMNETYDYLKNNIPRRYPKTSEERYLRNITKYVKESLKQIYNLNPVVCPNMKRRYEAHLKEHHSCTRIKNPSKTCECRNKNKDFVQHDASTKSPCAFLLKKLISPHQSSYCTKPAPCECEQGTSKSRPSQETKNNDYGKRIEDEVYEWLREIPVYADESTEAKSTRNTKIKQLSDTLKRLNEDELNEKGRDEIKKCIESLPIWYPSDKREKDKFVEELADKLLIRLNRIPKKDNFTDEASSFVPNRDGSNQSGGRKLSASSMENTLQRDILKWLIDSPELPIDLISDTNENKTIIRNLERILEKYNQNDLSDKDIQSQIQEDINGWLESAMKNKGRLDSATKNNVSRSLINRLIKSGALKPSKSDDINSHVYQLISDWFDNIPELSSSSSRNEKRKLIQSLADKLIGLDNDYDIRNEIRDWFLEILDVKREHLNVEDIDDLVEELVHKIRHVTRGNGRKRNESITKEKQKSNSRKRWSYTDDLSKSIQKELSPIVDHENTELGRSKNRDLRNNISSLLENNIRNKPRASQAAGSKSFSEKNKAKSKSFASKTMPNDLKQYLRGEISDVLKKMNISPEYQDEIVDILLNALEKEIENSTENNKAEENENARYASQEEDKTFDKSKKKQTVGFDRKITDEFSNIINNWIDTLPIGLNAEDSGLKETLVKDLATDILDRQKYLQVNPGIKFTDQEELEHLKYQIYRCFNKFVSPDELNLMLPKAQELMDHLKQVKNQGEIPGPLQHEISMWLEEITPYLNLSDTFTRMQMVKKLTDIIQQKGDNKNIDLNRKIEQCLYDVVKNKQTLNKISESLKNRLNQKGFTDDTSWLPVQVTSQIIEENMLDWLKELPLYQRRSPEEKRIQEQLIKKLAKNLKNISDNAQPNDNTDELFMNEIIKQLKQFPIEPALKNDEQFYVNTAALLLHYLKRLDIFHDRNLQVDSRERVFKKIEPKDLSPEKFLPEKTIGHSKTFASHTMPSNLKQYLRGEIGNILENFGISSEYQDELVDILLSAFEKEIGNGSDSNIAEVDMYSRKTPEESRGRTSHEVASEFIKRKSVTGEISFHPEAESTSLPIAEGYITDSYQDYSRYASQEQDETFDKSKKTPADLERKITNEFSDIINNWIDQLPTDLNLTEDKSFKEFIVKDLAGDIIDRVKYLQLNPGLKFTDQEDLEHLNYQIFKCLNKYVSVDDMKNILLKSQVLMDRLKQVKIPQLVQPFEKKEELELNASREPKKGGSKPGDTKLGTLNDWCKNLPIYLGDSPEDIEKVNTIKRNIASKLINKINELNMNSEMLNNELLQEQDKVNNTFSSTVSKNSELESTLSKLLNNLNSKFNEANQKSKNELTGQFDKQQSKETILPGSSKVSSEEETSFELLKDKIADAFTNLHYAGDDENVKNKFKRLIKDEVTKFCNDYLKRYPDQPIDSEKLNQDLYNALCNVSLPSEESMKSEMENSVYNDKSFQCKDYPCTSQIPLCTLSEEDKAHICRIRLRTRTPSVCMPRYNCKDAAISPCPVDSCTQTQIRPWCQIICNDKDKYKIDQQTQKTKALDTGVQSENNNEVSPRILVREYLWDSTEGQLPPNTQCFPNPDNPICPARDQIKNHKPSQPATPLYKQNVGVSCPSVHNPCASFQPYIAPQSSSSIQSAGPSMTQQKPRCTPICPRMRQNRDLFPQPCLNIEASGNSSCLASRRRKQIDSVRFPEIDNFLKTSCRSHTSPLTTDEELELISRDRENNHEKVRYVCRERTNTKCGRRKNHTCPRMADMAVRNCSKCSVNHCPYPSFMYFKQ